jgi:6-pyruvoyl-tetrahydropterin synthase
MPRSLRCARLACERRNHGHNFKTRLQLARIIEILGLHAQAISAEAEIETGVSHAGDHSFLNPLTPPGFLRKNAAAKSALADSVTSRGETLIATRGRHLDIIPARE